MDIIKDDLFKGTYNGKYTSLYTLSNKHGMIAQITNYGAIIVSIYVPDRKGDFLDIVQGYDSIKEYIDGNSSYQGAICGQCANRIANGKFKLNGKDYSLAINNGPNHLHGGLIGFSKVVWDVVSASETKVKMIYFAKDGEEGYPGNVRASVTYSITDDNELRIDYDATTDKSTIFNLASHSYFNLAGEGSGNIYNQELLINGHFFTAIDETCIPTGEILSVKGTPMDFIKPKAIGTSINEDDEQLKFGNGYDHNWVLNHRMGTLGLAAIASDSVSGRVMEIYTTQPGVQFYSANWMDGEIGKGGKKYEKHGAFCLETQHFANAINIPHFPSVILNPGETYKHTCVHKFLVK